MNSWPLVLGLAACAITQGCEKPANRIDVLGKQARALDPIERLRAAGDLGRVDTPQPGVGPVDLTPDQRRAVQLLRAMVSDDRDARVRGAAAEALGRLRPPGPWPELVQCVGRDVEVSCRCYGALRAVTDRAAPYYLPDLVALLPEAAADQRLCISAALGDFGNAVLPYLEPWLRRVDADTDLAYEIQTLLEKIGTHEAAAMEARLLENPHRQVRGEVLIRIKESRRVETFRATIEKLLSDPDPFIRSYAAEMLGVSVTDPDGPPQSEAP